MIVIVNSRTSTMDDFVRLPNHSTVNWFRNRIRRPSYMPRFGYIAVYGDGTSGFGNRIRRRKQSHFIMVIMKHVVFNAVNAAICLDLQCNLKHPGSSMHYVRSSYKLNIKCLVSGMPDQWLWNKKMDINLMGRSGSGEDKELDCRPQGGGSTKKMLVPWAWYGCAARNFDHHLIAILTTESDNPAKFATHPFCFTSWLAHHAHCC